MRYSNVSLEYRFGETRVESNRMAQTIEQKIAKLREELNHHNFLYYTEARPEVSDREYDRLMQELIELEAAHPELRSPNSPTQRAGGEPIEGFKSVQHACPMMS